MIAFQKNHGLETTGIIDSSTRIAMANQLDPVKSRITVIAKNAESVGKFGSISEGDNTLEVGKYQAVLANLGYYDGKKDNDYGPQTIKAIKKLMEDYPGVDLRTAMAKALKDKGDISKVIYRASIKKGSRSYSPILASDGKNPILAKIQISALDRANKYLRDVGFSGTIKPNGYRSGIRIKSHILSLRREGFGPCKSTTTACAHTHGRYAIDLSIIKDGKRVRGKILDKAMKSAGYCRTISADNWHYEPKKIAIAHGKRCIS